MPRDDGEFIARPRFLALREFGPDNILYYEGAKWEVASFQSPPAAWTRRGCVRDYFELSARVGKRDGPGAISPRAINWPAMARPTS